MKGFPLENFLLKVTKSVTFGILIFLSLLHSTPGFANWDLSMDSTIRSFPFGGSLNVNGGYGLLAYGSPPSGTTTPDPWYGYIRPSLAFSTAGSYNQYGAHFDFYPVSIFGFGLGSSITTSRDDYSAYDCDALRCRGDWSNQYARVELTVGYDIYFMVLQSRIEQWFEGPNDGQVFIEPESGVRCAPGHERIHMQRLILGMTPFEPWTFVGLMTVNTSERQKDRSEQFLAMAIYKWEKFSVAAGGGLYSSDLKDQSFTAAVRFVWTPFRSLALN